MSFLVLCACSKVNNTLVLELNGDASEGYIWDYTIEDNTIIESISDEYKSNSEYELTDSSGSYIYNFKAINKGKTKIIFKYKKQRTEEESKYSIAYFFEVDENKNIKLIDKKGTYIEGSLPEPKIK